VTIRWYTGSTGVEVPGSARTFEVAPLGTGGIMSTHVWEIPDSWGGVAKITSDQPVLSLVHRWYYVNYYRSWVVFKPIKDFSTGGTAAIYFAAVHKQSSGLVRIGDGFNTNFYVANLGTSVATVKFEIIRGSDGTVVYDQNHDIAVNGRSGWNTLDSAFDAFLGTNFEGGARFTVVNPPSGGRIAGIGETTLNGYQNTDAYGSYNAVNQ
jgi:hypothetical protein